jgi:hypothetical protein
MNARICPIMSKGELMDANGNNILIATDCQRDRCQWWDAITSDCAIKHLVRLGEKI